LWPSPAWRTRPSTGKYRKAEEEAAKSHSHVATWKGKVKGGMPRPRVMLLRAEVSTVEKAPRKKTGARSHGIAPRSPPWRWKTPRATPVRTPL